MRLFFWAFFDSPRPVQEKGDRGRNPQGNGRDTPGRVLKTTTVQQAAQALGVNAGVVRGLLATGYLKGQKVDRVWNVSLESVRVLQALLNVPLRVAAQLPTAGEQLAISAKLCPVCAGQRWGPARQGSEWTHEFLECGDCSFSVHQSFLDSGSTEKVRQRVLDHIQILLSLVRNGEVARECLQRRAQTLFPLDG